MQHKKSKVLISTSYLKYFSSTEAILRSEGYQVSFCIWDDIIKNVRHLKPSVLLLHAETVSQDTKVCHALRALYSFHELGIIVISSDLSEYNIIKWIDAGADDHLSFPTNSSIIAGKINALQKRLVEQPESISIVGDLLIDREKYQVIYKNKKIKLTVKEFEVLSLLTNKAGKVFIRDEILDLVWGDGVSKRMVDMHIHKIRQKLGQNSIQTVKGIGYRILNFTALSVNYFFVFFLSEIIGCL